jgi:hypothetical protein
LAALFDFFRQFAHGVLGDNASFTAGQRSLGIVEGGQEFRPLALSLFPQKKSFLHGIFLALKTSALNRLPNKRFLIGAEMHFHSIQA